MQQVGQFLLNYQAESLEKVYFDLNDYRKPLVKPMILTDDMYASQWQDELYEMNPYNQEEKDHADEQATLFYKSMYYLASSTPN